MTCEFCKADEAAIEIRLYEQDGTDLFSKKWKMCIGCRDGGPGQIFEGLIHTLIEMTK